MREPFNTATVTFIQITHGYSISPMPAEPDATLLTHWPPRVWAVLCYRSGDNTQILSLVEALGWPFEIKRLAYKQHKVAINLLRGTGLAGIDISRSSPLAPPWPDLIISAAFRNEPVCRWIQRQADHRVRYVHIGRPWARFDHFDLVIAVPEYRLARHPKVLHNDLSIHGVTAARLAEAAAQWAPRLAELPRPYIAVLVGGYSGPYTLDRPTAERLGRQASALAHELGGSLLVTTSARTPRSSAAALRAAIDAPAYFFQWTRQAGDNPYYGYLALADSLIVTCDSVSMLTEACATCKPVYIFDLDEHHTASNPALRHPGAIHSSSPGWRDWRIHHLKAALYQQMMRLPLPRLSRDIRLVHEYLIKSGHAVWLGQPFPPGPPLPPLEDTQRAVTRIRALFEQADG